MPPQLMRLFTLVVALGCVWESVTAQQTIEQLSKAVDQLSRQLMLQQLYVEERIRSDGGSGLKQTRQVIQGTLPYHANTVIGGRVAAAHDHANHIRTIGMGEFVAVLNGVEFRTRHNDYKLVQPQDINPPDDKSGYNAVKDIPFPEVPPEVTRQGSPEKQIVEMREWFKAWRDQNHTVRDYRPYFRPVLSYLEGGWTLSDGKTIDESFDSDRHFIDASSWLDLQDKIRFTSYSGRKDSAENFAYLPTTIISTGNGTTQLAQWNYRIACHPLKRDLSTKRLKAIDDISSRIAYGVTLEQHSESRAARYRVAPKDSDDWREQIIKGDLLDQLMAEVPGKDGYGNKLLDDGIDGKIAMNYKTPGKLPAGYYHRWFQASKDAMGSQSQHRAFSDENMFMARTTQEKVAPMSVEKCTGRRKNKRCFTFSQRWTYAIPMEIIYMTPLLSWNPYNIQYKGSHKTTEGMSVTNDGKLSGRSQSLALNGTNQKLFYHTPISFFQSVGPSKDAADTSGRALWVRDNRGVARQVVASGTRIHLPGIDGVGKLRTRFPIMTLHYEGSAAWKELTALKDIVLQPKRYSHMYYTKNTDTEEPTTVTLRMRTSKNKNIDPHQHYVYADLKDLEDLAKNPGKTLELTTEEEVGHTHTITLRSSGGKFRYTSCGVNGGRCWDGHPWVVDIVDD